MKKIITGIFALAVLSGVFLMTPAVLAQDESPAGQIQGGIDDISPEDDGPSFETSLGIIVNILLFLLGAIAVIMIVIGGIRYATSNGDQSAITSAKNTILYAVIGLLVAIMAYAIVNFVIQRF